MLVNINPPKKEMGYPLVAPKNHAWHRAELPVRDVIDLYPAIKLEVAIEFQILIKAGTPKERIDLFNARLWV